MMQAIPSKSQIRLLVCDLDGTLLNEAKQLTPRTKLALEEARKAGMKICFASGRYGAMMSVYSDCIGGCDYMVTSNGASAMQGETTLYHEGLSTQDVTNILTYCNLHDIPLVMYTVEEILIRTGAQIILDRTRAYEKLAQQMGYPTQLPYREVDFHDQAQTFENVIKIVIYEQDAQRAAAYFDFIATIPTLGAESTGYGVTGTYSNKVSKRLAVAHIMEDMHLSPDQVCVFGDYDNDLSMFMCATYKIAMGNALEEVKQAATYITASNEQDGVAQYIEKILQA